MFDFKSLVILFIPALLVLLIGALLIRILLKIIRKVFKKSTIDPMLHVFIINAVKIAAWSLLVVSVLRMVGVDTTSVITVLAACGAAIALALQGSLSNLAGGILIMATKPFKKGDFISCAGNSGSIDSIHLLHTYVITVDNQHISIPNSVLTSNPITNATKLSTRRVDIRIGVAYESDLDKAKQTILGMAAAAGSFLQDPAPLVNTVEYADSAVILEFRGWCSTEDYWKNYFVMQNGMKSALDAAGIEIPFAQIDIHTK